MRLVSLTLVASCLTVCPSYAIAVSKLSFWKTAPRGANISTTNPTSDFTTASEYGIRLVRFGATGSPGDLRYFVKGSAPNDEWDLSQKNITKLKNAIGKASQNNLRVVVSLAHIPGRAWEFRQRDNRIWENSFYQVEFVRAWRFIAEALKNNPGVVGYDLINEPYFPHGNAHKLWALYHDTIAAIREVDSETPIVLESSAMASPDTLSDVPIFAYQNVIYSFHYYEPFPFFSPLLNHGRLSYPGRIPTSDGEKPVLWNAETHRARLFPIRDWQIKNGIEDYRIFVGEFGAWRKANGAKEYLEDVVELFSEYGWSWSYYAFRENDWDVADLEIEGQSLERNQTELFRVLKNYFR